MNLKREFNRLSGLFGNGVEALHGARDDVAGLVRGEAKSWMKCAQRGLRHRSSAMSIEEMLMRHVRGNAALYLIAGIAIAAVLVARMMTAERPRALHEEW
jgi:hypothetical protein